MTAKKSSRESVVRKPGMDSSLSTVPPVWPRPRPLILAMRPPAAATMGQAMSVVLSPTPPVECLSTVELPKAERSTSSPEAAMASVSARISSSVMERKQIAMSIAAI